MIPLAHRAKVALDRIRLHRNLQLVEYGNTVRIGSDYGGWVVPADRLGPTSICYCVGIGEDTTFDYGLIERYRCNVHAFDPTPVAVNYISSLEPPSGFYFHPVGLWSRDGELLFHAPQNPDHASYSALNLQATKRAVRCPVRKLSTLMSELGHDRLDLLKMDIEGAEFEVLESLLADDIPIDTLCVEFHRDAGGVRTIAELISRLRGRGWMPICAERWNVTLTRLDSVETRVATVVDSPLEPSLEDFPASVRARSSAHHRGTKGVEYFDWQNEVGEIGADLNLWKFVEHVKPPDTVIDFGCGNGALLARLDARRRIGVEVNPAARQAAATRGIETTLSVDDVSAEIADVVISNHALEHTLNPLAELRGLYRALKPGGRIILWLPLDDWRSQRRYQSERNHHLFAWTPLSLGNLLEEAGFEAIETRVVAKAWFMFYRPFSRTLPRRVYALITTLTAVTARRRQLFASARRPPRS